MKDLEMARSILSDMHKDAYGFRPRNEEFWAGLDTPEACARRAEDLEPAIRASIEEENAREVRCIEIFEAAIQRTVEVGAGDRETAIRWLRDGEEDARYFEYDNGLPYGYLKGEDIYGTGWKLRVPSSLAELI
jgi:hypothetical protein